MNHRSLGAVALAFALAAGTPGDAHAFGRGLLRGAAKREAKKRAKKEVVKKVAEDTGVNVGGLVDGDLSGAAQGMAKDAAMGAVAQSAAGPYAKYLGMQPGDIKEALKAEVMKEQGVTKFSPPSARRQVDNIVEERFGKVQQALQALQGVGALKGNPMGGLGNLTGGGSGAGGMQAHIEMERAVAKRNLAAAGYDDHGAVDALADHAAATVGAADDARARADAGLAPLRGAPAAAVAAKLTESRAQAEERIRAEVYRSKGISSGSPRIKKILADKEVEKQLSELFK